MSIPKLTKNQRELATQLVHKSLELNPEVPPDCFRYSPIAGSTSVSLSFDGYPREQIDFALRTIGPLVSFGLVIQEPGKGNRYTLTQALYDLVENDFSPPVRDGWMQATINANFAAQVIGNGFDHTELNDLCFHLDIDPGDIGSDSAAKVERIERLIRLAIDKGTFGQLLREIDRERIGTDWVGLFED